jgi:hypothetical protein
MVPAFAEPDIHSLSQALADRHRRRLTPSLLPRPPCATNHSDSNRRWSGVVPNWHLSNSVLALAFDVGHNHGQHLFVNVNSRYSVSHTLPPGGSGKRAATYINQGRGLSPFPKGRNDAQLFAQPRTLRIRQTVGLDLSVARSTSPLQPVAILLRSYFHKVSRAAGPTMTNRKFPGHKSSCGPQGRFGGPLRVVWCLGFAA